MKKYDKNEDFIIYPLLQGLGMPHCCFGNIPETPLGFKTFPGTLRLYWTPRTTFYKPYELRSNWVVPDRL